MFLSQVKWHCEFSVLVLRNLQILIYCYTTVCFYGIAHYDAAQQKWIRENLIPHGVKFIVMNIDRFYKKRWKLFWEAISPPIIREHAGKFFSCPGNRSSSSPRGLSSQLILHTPHPSAPLCYVKHRMETGERNMHTFRYLQREEFH